MSKKLSKDDSKRIRKLEDSLKLLKDGSKKHFSITRLISIKSLCNNQEALRKYCLFLSGEILKQSGELPRSITKKQMTLIFDELVFDSGRSEKAQKLLQTLAGSQNEIRKVGWNSIRVINSNEMLILEYLLKALLASEGLAQTYAYDATKYFVEKYNSMYGTGLIVDSIPMFEKVIEFWQKYERNVCKTA